jgi:hypothetical protein
MLLAFGPSPPGGAAAAGRSRRPLAFSCSAPTEHRKSKTFGLLMLRLPRGHPSQIAPSGARAPAQSLMASQAPDVVRRTLRPVAVRRRSRVFSYSGPADHRCSSSGRSVRRTPDHRQSKMLRTLRYSSSGPSDHRIAHFLQLRSFRPSFVALPFTPASAALDLSPRT